MSNVFITWLVCVSRLLQDDEQKVLQMVTCWGYDQAVWLLTADHFLNIYSFSEFFTNPVQNLHMK